MILMLSSGWIAFAQSPGTTGRYVVSKWQMPDGLPSDQITAVAQTGDGYLWVATPSGLARFDGVRFQTFNAANTPVLRDDSITCLYADRTGRLWIGNTSGEVFWRDEGGFHALDLGPDWGKQQVLKIRQSANGSVWVLNKSGSLALVRGPLGRTVNLLIIAGTYDDVVPDITGPLWGKRRGGSVVMLEDGKEVAVGAELNERIIGRRDIAAARQGGIWVKDGERLRRWQDGRWVEDRGRLEVSTVRRTSLFETRNGALLVGTRGRGVFVVHAGGRVEHVTQEDGLPQNEVADFWEDVEGNIWVATEGGLARLRRGAVTMVGLPHDSPQRAVSSVARASDGGLWVVSEGAGVFHMDGNNSLRAVGRESSRLKTVGCVFEDRMGQVWLGTELGAVGLLTNGQFQTVPVPMDRRLSIQAMFQSLDGALWVGTQNGILRHADGEWQLLGRTTVPTDRLFRGDVRCFAETPDGAVWFGMSGGGLGCWRQGVLNQFRKAEGLPSDFVWSLYTDGEGTLWVGTWGAGLVRYRDGQFVQLSTSQGLPSDYICQIEDAGGGKLFVGSLGGIFHVNTADLNQCAQGKLSKLACLILDASEGLTSSEMVGGRQPSSCRTDDGRLWFGTRHGLAAVNPNITLINTMPPPVWIEEVRANGKPLIMEKEDLDQSGGSRVRVPPGSGQIEFRYTATSLSAPDRVRFKYQLEGLENDLLDGNKRRAVNYNSLSPGNYRFRVIACNNDGIWNETGASLWVDVLPFFWQRWWFAPLCWAGGLGTAGAAGLSVVRRRHRARVAALERARALERERARIAQDLHDDLGADLAEVVLLGELAQQEKLPAEETKTRVAEMTGKAREVMAAMDEIVWTVNPRNDSLPSLASYIAGHARKFFQPTPIHCRLDIMPELPSLALTSLVRHNLFLAVKEVLHNAASHSGAREVWLRMRWAAGEFTLEVQDDGRGFDAGRLAEKGDGLENIHQRLSAVGGSADIVSRPGEGTTVRLSLPVAGKDGNLESKDEH